MKKKVLLITSFILVLTLGVLLGVKFSKSNFYEEEDYVPEVTHKHMLSMMLETDSGLGEYSLEERSSWPTKEDGYVFNSTLSKCEKGSKLRWDDENNAVVMVGTTSDKCYVYFDVYSPPTLIVDVCSSGDNLANCVKTLYQESNSDLTHIYYHDSTLVNGAGDNSYRFAGASDTVNNFVCFSSNAETCPDDNLYKIIGVFGDQVKLIKWDYANSDLLGEGGDYNSSVTYLASSYSNYTGSKERINRYYWNQANKSETYNATGYYNDWSYSELNKTHLNINYLTNIGTEWANMIDTTVWKVGGFASADVVLSTVYTNEITSPSTQVTSTYESKVGLMYVSDYAFAAAPTAWTTSSNNYDGNDASGNKITEENWMYMGLEEWTMTRSSSYSYFASGVGASGFVTIYSVVDNPFGVRPVFHLISSVEYSSGSGTKNDPIRIKID